jgi:hypothetical protein
MPGHVVIFMAGDIYHYISEWKPIPGVSEYGITPGRIGHVFFSPKSALDVLHDKPPFWRNVTYSGFWPEASGPRETHRKDKSEKKRKLDKSH